MRSFKKEHIIAAISTVLLGLTLLSLIIVGGINSSLSQKLDAEKLRSEALLSEKLLLEKAAKKSARQLSTLSDINSTLGKESRESKTLLGISYHKNDSLTNLIGKMKDRSRDQLVQQRKLKQQIEVEKSAYSNLLAGNRQLSDSVMYLMAENKFIADELITARRVSIDHTLVTAVKSKESAITGRAHCARKLIANVEVSAALKNLNFILYDPEGTPLSEDKGVITSRILQDDYNYTASAGGNSNGTVPETQRVEIVYTRKQRLQPGIYMLQILNDSLYVGSMQVKLK